MTAHGAGEARELASALTQRALGRAVLGAALVGVALGALAVVFLVMSGSRLGAATLPVVLLAMIGQLAGLAGAAGCALRLRRLGAGAIPQDVAAGAEHFLRRLAGAVVVGGAAVALTLPVVLEPTGSAVLASLLGAGLLAQAVVVLTVLRRPLGRASRAPQRGGPAIR